MARHAPAARLRRAVPRLVLVASFALVAAACGSQATPTPSASSGSPATPSGPAASSASAAPTASPSASPSTAAIQAFVRLVTKDGFSYQATFSGEDRHSASILKIRNGLLQVHGDDVRVRATFADATGDTTVESRTVGGKSWLRFATGVPWERYSLSAAQTMAAFAKVRSVGDVTYLKTVKTDGKTLFQVEVSAAILHPKLIPYINLSDESVRKGSLTILIDAAGHPIRGTTDINATGRISGQLQEIVIDLTVTFTKVGAAVTIAAP